MRTAFFVLGVASLGAALSLVLAGGCAGGTDSTFATGGGGPGSTSSGTAGGGGASTCTTCPVGQYCDEALHACKNGCSSNTDCDMGELCDLSTHSCKGCGSDADCKDGKFCDNGQCVACSPSKPCAGSETCCDGACADLQTDAANCGGCGAPCVQKDHATVGCDAGSCVVASCDQGFGDCDQSYANGCETATSNDSDHCGTCDIACVGSCVGGLCDTACDPGTANCDNDPGNGCETNVASSVTDCGGCGQACDATNGTPSCVAAKCTIVCDNGFGNCDGDPSNGCETNTDTDELNCGACQQSCPVTCQGGTCDVKRVFMTSILTNGNMGGLAGADMICQNRASIAGLPGTYKAWLSDKTTSAASRLTHATVPYLLTNGTVVANDWNDLVDGSLQAGISADEFGNPGPAQPTACLTTLLAWTNTTEAGAVALPTGACLDWTDDLQGSPTVVLGKGDSTDAMWTNGCNSVGSPCNGSHALYCFEQ